ncbi:MAG: CopD family protein, partial [Mycobacteriaceae bacterium]
MSTVPSQRNNVATRLLILITIGLSAFMLASTSNAQAEEAPSPTLTLESSPAANSVLSQAPSMILFHPSQTLSSSISAQLLNSSGTIITEGQLSQIPGSTDLALNLPHLPQGLYTTTWTYNATSGSFSFSVSDSAPAAVTSPTPSPKLKPLLEIILTWLPAITLMTFVGILFLLLVVVRPVGRKTTATVANRRLHFIAFAAITLFIPAFITELSHNPKTGFHWQNLTKLFQEEGSGTVLRVHIVLILIAWAITLVTLCYKHFQQKEVTLLAIATVVGMGALICDRFPTSSRGNFPRTVFSFVMWIGHLGGSALWLGGLIGLLALILPGGVSGDSRKTFWIFVIRRFTFIATAAVALLVLSGLWLYWLHVDGFQQLISTLYGQTLSVKLII